MSAVSSDLANRMKVRPSLSTYEHRIEAALFAYAEAGDALRAIRDGRLYKETHKSFEAYCRDRWGWSRVRAHQMIEAAGIHDLIFQRRKVLTMVNTFEPPRSERVARELMPLKDKPQVLTETWAEVVQHHGPDATAGQVKRLVAEVLPAAEEQTLTVTKTEDDAEKALQRLIASGYSLGLIKNAIKRIEGGSNA